MAALAELNSRYTAKFGSGTPSTKFVPWFNHVNTTFNASPVVATSMMIWDIPEGGLKLVTAGTYRLGKSFAFKGETAITIEGNDIILDLSGHCLNMCGTGVGIRVKDSIGVTVRNGTVKCGKLHGIFIEDSAVVTVTDVKVCKLQNSDSSLTPAAILANVCTDVTVENVTVCNNRACGTSMFGVLFTVVIGCAVKSSHFCCQHNHDGATAAVGHILCDAIEVSDVHVREYSSGFGVNFDAEGHTCIGILPVYTTNILIEDCAIRDIAGSCDDAHGISVFLCEDALVQNCKVNGVTTGKIGKTSAKTTGIEIYATNAEVTDCCVHNITATNPGDRQCTGFSTAKSDNVLFDSCRASCVTVFDVRGNINKKAAGRGMGFGWAPDPRATFAEPSTNVTYQDCTAVNCQVGFDTWYHIDSTWTNIKCCNTDQKVLICPNGKRTLTCNRCSECPGGMVTTLTNVATGNSVEPCQC